MATEKRLIDANALAEQVGNLCADWNENWIGNDNQSFILHSDVSDLISDAPTVDAVEVVHGRWVDRYGGKYANPLYECSECKKKAPYKFEDDSLHIGLWLQDLTDYCPNCGAKMDGGVDNGG